MTIKEMWKILNNDNKKKMISLIDVVNDSINSTEIVVESLIDLNDKENNELINDLNLQLIAWKQMKLTLETYKIMSSKK